jgi:shikimate dehydrogenase
MPTQSILVGLIGAGIEASRAARLHEKEGDDQGLRCLYRLIDLDVLGLSVEALPELLTAAERLGFTGLNITYPCKHAVIEHLHKVAPDARAIGVVNTVLFRDGRRSVTIPTGRDLRKAFDARFPTSAAIAWLNSARAAPVPRYRTRC